MLVRSALSLNDWLERSGKEFAPPYSMALLCFDLGKTDLGFQWLEKGYEEHEGTNVIDKAG